MYRIYRFRDREKLYFSRRYGWTPDESKAEISMTMRGIRSWTKKIVSKPELNKPVQFQWGNYYCYVEKIAEKIQE